MTANGSSDTVTLEIIRASEVTPREVKWLWYPYIPFGKITLLQGDPGDGKSKFMLALSALLTDGKPLPFQEAEEASGPMTVIYQTTEDDADDTVVPRFIASGGNRDNLIFIKENEKHLTFGDDRLQQAIERYNVKLLILDPLSSYIGEDCSMNDANKTRTELNHLIKIGQETGCAIVVNMLKITNDGRKLALDQRLINDMLPDNETSKAATCVGKAFEIWEQTKGQKSTQLIFCDLSTPKGDGTFNVYEDIKNKLVEKGVPPEEIAFIHEANTETRKAELFGKVRVNGR